jgi:hypothetical protein
MSEYEQEMVREILEEAKKLESSPPVDRVRVLAQILLDIPRDTSKQDHKIRVCKNCGEIMGV